MSRTFQHPVWCKKSVDRFANIARVYRGDAEDNLDPPQESLDAIANLCVLLQISVTVFYKTGLSENAEYQKITITLES